MKTKTAITGLVLTIFLIGNTHAYMGYGGGSMMGYGYQYEKDEGNILDRFLGKFGYGRYGHMNGNGFGPGMMGSTGCDGWGYGQTITGEEITVEEATSSIERYIDGSGLEIKEVMDFEYSYYAQIVEPDTGIGAFEVLVDKYTGTVRSEPGPNMMWNTKYGHMTWGEATENTVKEDEAIEAAQEWLDTGTTGLTAEEHADEFYGYYTIHILEDHDIVGMLSVHGETGAVWYHNWHGDYLGDSGEGH